MKRLRVPKFWRPTWKTFWLTAIGFYIGIQLLNLLSSLITGNGVGYPADSIFDWIGLILAGIMLLVVSTLFIWLLYRPTPPHPHPFGTRDFWLTVTIFLLIAIPLGLILEALGVWSALIKARNGLGAVGYALPIIIVLGFMEIWKRLPAGAWYKRPSISAGLGCGLWLSIFMPVCVAIVWLIAY